MRTDPSKCGLPAQLDRLYRAVKMIKASYNSNYPIIWAGDINIYQSAPNNSLDRPDIRPLNDILESENSDLNLEQVNFKPTKYWRGWELSVLDL